MTRARAAVLGAFGIGLAVCVMAIQPGLGARQTEVQLDGDDIGGVVNGPSGPEAGVWVIAETLELPTRFNRTVVTDDEGRYVVPDLPEATYDVWVRGYGLVDSPVGQAAWILEKFWAWSDCDGHPENALSRNELLDNVMMYWLTEAGASSARIYWESFSVLGEEPEKVNMPTGGSMFPKEIFRASKRWVEDRFTNLIHFNTLDKGGHFAAFEQPVLFVDELRTCFGYVR